MTDYASMLAADLEALALERGIDAEKVKGSGAGGNVLKTDWIKALEKLDRKEAKALADAEVEAESLEPVEDEAGDAPETAEVDPEAPGLEPLEEEPSVKPAPASVETADEKALRRLRRAVYGDAVDQPEGELLTRAADLIDYLRKRK
jgi:pyruvate/2-oxoglutarate dehydrogenase complex dihydrolipoamide acyltransferase (E2) component